MKDKIKKIIKSIIIFTLYFSFSYIVTFILTITGIDISKLNIMYRIGFIYIIELIPLIGLILIYKKDLKKDLNDFKPNIEKYADRQEPIFFSTNRTDDYLIISFRNKIAAAPYSPSTGIGVKNIALMMQKMNGKMEQFADSTYYEIQLYFPICQDSFPSESTC